VLTLSIEMKGLLAGFRQIEDRENAIFGSFADRNFDATDPDTFIRNIRHTDIKYLGIFAKRTGDQLVDRKCGVLRQFVDRYGFARLHRNPLAQIERLRVSQPTPAL